MKIVSILILIFMAIDFLLVVGIVIVARLGMRVRPRRDMSRNIPGKNRPVLTLRKEVVRERWQKVLEHVALGTPEALKLAVIEADKVLSEALRQMGLPGEHVADRLSHLDREDVRSLDGAWRSHHLRNELAHTPGFALSRDEAEKAVRDCEAFLKEVEVL